MGCICSKEKPEENALEKEKEKDNSSVQLVAPVPSKAEEAEKQQKFIGGNDGSTRPKGNSRPDSGSLIVYVEDGDKRANNIEKEDKNLHKKIAKVDSADKGGQANRILGSPCSAEGEQIAAGWPSWLTSVAAEAIQGLVPRGADSFEKLEKIGQGTYSTVYKARDLETGKIVAMKKVRFVNMDPESVRFMAREIHILRKLDHPNVMKLEALVTSRVSGSFYLVFEYMEHDLAGLAATRGIKFTESQIKCYMQQLLRGLEHCHSRGVLHRDIKGSNLLLDSNGILKIGDFGLATFYQPDQNHPLTSRVVTLWYRAPELLLGATEYGVAIDLWSAGCILAELFAGKPIMPGRTEVEQMHKIFKICGSPSEDYWQRKKLPLATSFKPQQPYMRRIAETFKNFPPTALALVDKLLSIEPEDRGSVASALTSEFFTQEPLPCDPSSLPKYPPSKELHAKVREEISRRKADTVNLKGRGPEAVRRREMKGATTPEFNGQGEVSLQAQANSKANSYKYNPNEDGGTGFRIDPSRRATQNGVSQSTSVIHPAVAASSARSARTTTNGLEWKTQKIQLPQAAGDLLGSSNRRGERPSSRDSSMGYVPRKNRIHYSGPLMPPGGNMEDMLKEHERQIQQAVRRANQGKAASNRNEGGKAYRNGINAL